MTGIPLRSTRDDDGAPFTTPPCGQTAVNPTCRIGPGIEIYVIDKAPPLMLTAGPIRTMDAPFPFCM